jgi:hypothetical protein
MCLGQFRGYSHQDPRSQCPTRYPTIIFNVIILFIAANTKLLYFSDIYHSIVTTILRWMGIFALFCFFVYHMWRVILTFYRKVTTHLRDSINAIKAKLWCKKKEPIPLNIR